MSWGVGHWGLGAWAHCISGGPDLDTPVLSLQSPPNGASYVPPTAPLSFRLTEPTSLVDLASVELFVTMGSIRKLVFALGRFQPPYTSGSWVRANANNGFDFFIVPNTPWISGSVVVVDLSASDSFCNELVASWSFETTPCYGCVT